MRVLGLSFSLIFVLWVVTGLVALFGGDERWALISYIVMGFGIANLLALGIGALSTDDDEVY